MPGLYSGLLKSRSFFIHDTRAWAGNLPKDFGFVLWDSNSLKKGSVLGGSVTTSGMC